MQDSVCFAPVPSPRAPEKNLRLLMGRPKLAAIRYEGRLIIPEEKLLYFERKRRKPESGRRPLHPRTLPAAPPAPAPLPPTPGRTDASVRPPHGRTSSPLARPPGLTAGLPSPAMLDTTAPARR